MKKSGIKSIRRPAAANSQPNPHAKKRANPPENLNQQPAMNNRDSKKNKKRSRTPLDQQILDHEFVNPESKKFKYSSKPESKRNAEESEEGYIPPSLTKKILRQAKQQQIEEEESSTNFQDFDDDDEFGDEDFGDDEDIQFDDDEDDFDNFEDEEEEMKKDSKKDLKKMPNLKADIQKDQKFAPNPISKKISENKFNLDTTSKNKDKDEDSEFIGEYYDHEIEIDEADQKVLDMFMSTDAPERRTLADIIMEKIREKEEKERRKSGGNNMMEDDEDMGDEVHEKKLDRRVIEVYSTLGKVLKGYTSGKLPKAFKIIPALKRWEEILLLTNPDEWSPAAMFQATKTFTSNLNSNMAQRFFNMVLLPTVRNNISENKKLNFHLYMSLKKALFKSAAFYKGILLPLCKSGDCSLKEAMIVGSVLSKVSIPVLQSSAALLKISEMEYSPANSLFVRILLEKKYSLPFRVVDSLVIHFMSFAKEERVMPVLWHQSLLSFVEHYKTDLSAEQKDGLRLLMRQHTHPLVTEAIRRELAHSKDRDESGIQKIEIDY